MRYRNGGAAALLLLVSCASYRGVELNGRIAHDHSPSEQKRFVSNGKLDSYTRVESVHVTRKLFFHLIDAPEPGAVINSEAVEEALRGNFAAAQFLFDEALAEYPSDAALANNKGCVYELGGNKELAAQWYFAALQLDPENSRYRSNLNGVYFNTAGGQPENAEVQVEESAAAQ